MRCTDRKDERTDVATRSHGTSANPSGETWRGAHPLVWISVIGFLTGRPEFLDLALIYVLINFIGTIAVLKFVQYGDLGVADGDQEGAQT